VKYLVFIYLCFSISTSWACDENDLATARALEELYDVQRLHNCTIQINKSVEADFVRYMIYGRDEYACSNNFLKCHDSTFELLIPTACYEAGLGEFKSARKSYKLDVAEKDIRSFFEIKLNYLKQPVLLQFGQTNIRGWQRINYIKCTPDFNADYSNLQETSI
jgi:hypothetical protein